MIWNPYSICDLRETLRMMQKPADAKYQPKRSQKIKNKRKGKKRK